MVIVSGNVGSATTRSYNKQDGTQGKVLDFTVAENIRGYKGEKRTNWFRVALFDKAAEALEKYVVKGTLVEVSGDLNPKMYDRKDGDKGLELSIDNPKLKLLGGGNKSENSATEAPAPSAPADDNFINVPDGLDAEIPFA